MADYVYKVELTANFLDRLAEIEAFLVEAGAASAYDTLLSALRLNVIPNLARFPRIGRPYLDNPPQSAEAMALLATLPRGSAAAVREYLHGDYLMLYIAVDSESTVYLLTIRHHRQLSFDFGRLWPGNAMLHDR